MVALAATATAPAAFGATSGGAAAPVLQPRTFVLDLKAATQPMDRAHDLSIGADFPGTLGREDSLGQVKTMVDELGMRFIRFHAIFHDVLGTVTVKNGQTVYDFSGIDRLYDGLLARGIKPFVELGFTPAAMATSPQTIFYWKGNTSHPEPAAWRALVDAFARHLIQRYGAAEVRSWYFEVWNEPNLDGFWEKADQPAYFALYADTARVLKAVDPALRVGGPATAGADWVVPFLAYAKSVQVPVDFVTTHTYGVDGGFLDEHGVEDRKLSPSPDAIVGDVRRVREQIQASDFPGLPLFITEWSTSYNPRDLVHDSYISAPYILTKLRQTRGLAQGMSYWTYSDLFEEAGPPPAPFHGGFGLMTREGVRKPAWFAYKYLNALRGLEIPVRPAEGGTPVPSDDQVLATRDGDQATALVWDWQTPDQPVSNRTFFGRPVPAGQARPVHLQWHALTPGRYRVEVRRTGHQRNDAFTAWLEMGSPVSLNADQLSRLQGLTQDRPETSQTIRIGAKGRLDWRVPMRSNDIVLVTLRPEGQNTRDPAGTRVKKPASPGRSNSQ
ncbi:GH39 family glycosyl hydrolase [Roseateles amylovorans]|uniref:Beta-xylosidase n=1 Tax=Roseateles amylovorans TaxID=2978473 RepID=A0ABY6B5M5_9BURK|nr:beta-xylosidase [Roseateles amylovorans]UXH80701.1 beta-xylosidase [Roseateles amylovorans]